MATHLLTSGVPVFRTSSGEPVTFRDGVGARVWTRSGRSCIDYVLGYGPVVLGHADEEFVESLLGHIGNSLMLPGFSELHEDLAARYAAACRKLEGRDVGAGFFKSSSESVAAACRLASAKTGRSAILRCGFLGWLDVSLASTPRWHERLNSPLRTRLSHDTGFRGVTGAERVVNWVDGSLDTFVRLLDESPDGFAAFLIDAYQLELLAPSSVMQAVAMARSRGIQIVYDETKTAGRTSALGSFSTDFPNPDIRVLGKAIANGLPLSIVLSDREDGNLFAKCRLGGTYAKERLSVAAALVVQSIMERRAGYSALEDIGKSTCTTINSVFLELGLSESIRAVPCLGGALFDLEFRSQLIANIEARQRLAALLLEEGVIILQGHPSYVSLAHKHVPLDELHGCLRRGVVRWARHIELKVT
jgi:glutamate-1-semialdehyde 2,1-aminomutase